MEYLKQPISILKTIQLLLAWRPTSMTESLKKKNWDTSTLDQVSNFNGVMLEIISDHKFQGPHDNLKEPISI